MKKPYWIKVVSGICTVAVIGTTVGVCYINGPVSHAEDNQQTEVTSEEGSAVSLDGDTDEVLSNLLENRVTHSNSSVDKEETVFVMGNANGSNNKIVVTDWLKNNDGADTITDQSSLSDITNLKGDETYKKSGDQLIWDAKGNDIHYQGTAKQAPPIDVKVTYYLDDKEISPEKLAGQSGHVKIRFDYTNTSKDTISVSGNEQEDINVPFGVMSGMLLDNDKFSNVEVTNGKVVDEGDIALVMGVAFPGLQKSLDLSDDQLGDTVIPDSVEVEADVVDFSLDMTMSVALSDTLEDFDISNQNIDTSELTDSMDDLQNASTKLVNGTSDLNNGVDDLSSGASDLHKGTTDLKNGATDMKGGIEKLYSGVKTYTDGVGTLTDGMDELKTGGTKLYDGIANVQSGAGQLDQGLNTLLSGSAVYDSSMNKLNSAMQLYYKDQLTQWASCQSFLSKNLDTATYQAVMNNLPGLAISSKVMEQISANSQAAAAQGDPTILKNTINQIFAGTVMSYSASPSTIGLSSSDEVTQLANSGLGYVAFMLHTYVPASTSSDTTASTLAASLYSLPTLTVSQSSEQANLDVSSNDSTTTGSTSDSVSDNNLKTQTVENQTANDDNDVTYYVLTQDDISNLTNSLQATPTTISYADLSTAAWDAFLCGSVSQLTTSEDQIYAGVQSAKSGADTLYAGTGTLLSGMKSLDDGIASAKQGAHTLDNKANDMLKGVLDLYDGSGKLLDGADKLNNGTADLVNGVATLKNGTADLNDGMVQFDQDGIQKLTDNVNEKVGDVNQFSDRLNAIIDAGKNYESYSGLASGKSGDVKFIYKTAAIKDNDEK